MAAPPWMGNAFREIGNREIKGRNDNPAILGYAKTIGAHWVEHDEVPWCAAFVGACLENAGIRSSRSMRARSYSDFGDKVDTPLFGAIAVFRRGNDPSKGHVGFVFSADRDKIYVLGGNQSDSVNVSGYSRSRLVALRWPSGFNPQIQDERNPEFLECLTHILRHEGGWSDDPYDPGGATNQGITLSRYASHIGEKLDGGNRARLIAALKNISPAAVREIYFRRYWHVSRAGQLPAGLALMHFDCAVNQGPARAAKFLQSSVLAEVDGEIGPLTLSAAHKSDVSKAITRYHRLRTRHYRGLSHFWRFGRGWLSRVDDIREVSLRHLSDNGEKISEGVVGTTKPKLVKREEASRQTNEENGMTQVPKWWGQSMTIWGAIITALSTVLPLVGPIFGIELSADVIDAFGAQVLTLMQMTGGVLGTVITVYGRVRADKPLEQRAFMLKV